MKPWPALFLFALVALLKPFAADVPSQATASRDLSAWGFPVTVEEITLAIGLNKAASRDAEEIIRADWAWKFRRIEVRQLPVVQNRYVLFTDDRSSLHYIAIRGTVNLKNALFDLQFQREHSALLGIDLHRGFERVALAVFEDVKPRLDRNYVIHLSGHSLGAAEAEILGMLFVREGYKVARVIATGVPKITDASGWAKFSALFVIRVVVPDDPVPFMPPHSLYDEDPYTQGGRALMLLDGNKVCALGPEFFDSMNAASRQASGAGLKFDVPDHMLTNYSAHIAQKQSGVEFVDPGVWMLYAGAGKIMRKNINKTAPATGR